MASACGVLLSFCIFLSFTAVTTEENTISYIFTTTAVGDHNVTHNVTDNYTTQLIEFESTTSPSYLNTEPVQLTQPTELLPVSVRLLTSVTEGNLSLAGVL